MIIGWEDNATPWYEIGDYNGEKCGFCNRYRVMSCDAPDGTQHSVCEKCHWDNTIGNWAAAND